MRSVLGADSLQWRSGSGGKDVVPLFGGEAEASVLVFGVEVSVGVTVAVRDDGAELEDGLGAGAAPAVAGDVEAVGDQVAASFSSYAGGDRPVGGGGGVEFCRAVDCWSVETDTLEPVGQCCDRIGSPGWRLWRLGVSVMFDPIVRGAVAEPVRVRRLTDQEGQRCREAFMPGHRPTHPIQCPVRSERTTRADGEHPARGRERFVPRHESKARKARKYLRSLPLTPLSAPCPCGTVGASEAR
jgi:hypothetical protein